MTQPEVIRGPWPNTPVEQSNPTEEEPQQEGVRPHHSTRDRVLEAGRAGVSWIRRAHQSERAQEIKQRVHTAIQEIRDGLAAQRTDWDEVALRQYHVDGDPANPVLPERMADYRWAVERLDKKRHAAQQQRAQMSDLDKGLEFAAAHGDTLAAGAGWTAMLADLTGAGLPNWLTLTLGAVGCGATWKKTRDLRAAGREYRRRLVQQAVALQRVQGSEPHVDGKAVEPIASARTETEALEYTGRALLASGISVRPVGAVREPWGWTVTVDLKGGGGKKPSDVVKAVEQLEVDLGLDANGVIAQPTGRPASRVQLRLVQQDPFAQVPPPPEMDPRSRSITDPIYIGQRLDGALVSVPVPATHGIVLAPSGGGKSILLRAITDGAGASRDAILWDLDPTGRGQSAQRRLFRRRALTKEDCLRALELAIRIAQARTRLHLADNWPASPEHPALVILLDEYPKLCDKGKAAAVALMEIGRKAGVWVIFAAQKPKADSLGEDVASDMGLQAGGPGLADWQQRMLFGNQAVADGWRPSRYRPALSDADPRDAGTFYLKGTVVDRGTPDVPLPTKIAHLSSTVAEQRAARYAADGLVPWDEDTLRAADLTAEELDDVTSEEAAAAAAAEAAVEAEQERLTDEERDILLDVAAELTEQLEQGTEEILAGDLYRLSVPYLQQRRGDRSGLGAARSVLSSALHKLDVVSREDRTGGRRRTYYSMEAICEAAERLAEEVEG